MARDYWSTLTSSRLTRRRALAATGGAGLGAVLLAACGSSNDKASSSSAKGNSSLLTAPADTSKTAKRGGTNKWFLNSEPAGLDVHSGGNPKNNPKNLVYSNLVSEKPGYLKAQDYSDFSPDIAQSWEWSPDALQLTVKIQPNAKWHNKAPVNGRPFEMADLIFSWNRFVAKGRDRGAMVNSVNPDAPVVSFTATDEKTAVIKLKEPTVYLLALFAPITVGKAIIIPKETDSTFDIEKDMIGTGPYMLTNYTPSVGMTFKKHPDYFEKDFAFFDTIEAPFVLEYAQQLAQFKAGNIYALIAPGSTGAHVRQEDLLPLKNDMPDMKIYANEPSGFSGSALNFGWQGQNQFKDERVRQAVSMSWDRDAYIDVFSNGDKLRPAGLDVKSYWASSLSAGTGSWRLDPKSKDFGPNAKYLQHDIAEAKKLLAAAGYPDGFELISSYIPGPQLGDSYPKENQILEDMARQVGFKPKTNLIDYATKYPNYRDGNGKYEGWSYIAGPTTADDAVGMLTWRYSKAGGAGYLGFDTGSGDGSGDPQVNQMLKKAQAELDTEKRKAMVFELQRYLAGKMYNVPKPGEATYFTTAWPAIRNHGVYKGDRRTDNYYWWLDDTQAPLKKS